MVQLNYNFIFTYVKTCGTTTRQEEYIAYPLRACVDHVHSYYVMCMPSGSTYMCGTKHACTHA